MSNFRAGLGITPLRIPGWEQSGDGTPLVARCLVLEDSPTRLCVLSVTVAALCLPEVRLVRDAVAEAARIAPEAIFVACTHIHSGPPTLVAGDRVRRASAECIARACAQAAGEAAQTRSARVGDATDRLPGVSRVRRILRRDGTVITVRRACPATWGWAQDPATVGPEEPVDDRLTLVRIDDADGNVLGALMHFPCHPIPDFTGYAAAMVERALPGTVCLVLNGCSGTVDTPFEQPMRGKTQGGQLPILGDILGYRSLELLARAETGAGGRPSARPHRLESRPGRTGAVGWPHGAHTGHVLTLIPQGGVAFRGPDGQSHRAVGSHARMVQPRLVLTRIGPGPNTAGAPPLPPLGPRAPDPLSPRNPACRLRLQSRLPAARATQGGPCPRVLARTDDSGH